MTRLENAMQQAIEDGDKIAVEIERKLLAEIEQLKQQLEAANKACAEMRELIITFRQQVMPGSDLPPKYTVWIAHALSTDCGKDMFTREQVMPLVEALQDLTITHIASEALTHARSIGLLKEGE